jgi:hypothetical protein
MNYMHSLCNAAAAAVAEIWGTPILIQNKEMYQNMINVQLPIDDFVLAREAQQQMLFQDYI